MLLLKTIGSKATIISIETQVAQLVNNLPANAGDLRDVGSVPGSGRSPGVGNGNPLHNSCLGNPTDRGDCWVPVYGDSKSQTQLSK